MEIEVLLRAQYYDNKGNDNWKPKGVSHFKVTVDNYWLMYSEKEEVTERFSEIISEQSNDYSRYEYVDHEILWYGIKEIDEVIE